jgi:hypothetical protein
VFCVDLNFGEELDFGESKTVQNLEPKKQADEDKIEVKGKKDSFSHFQISLPYWQNS